MTTMRRIEEQLNTYGTLCYLHAGPAKAKEARDDVVATIRAALQPDAGGWGEDDDRHRANEEHERAVEAWAARFSSAMLSYSHDWGLPDEEAYKPFGVAEKHAAIRALLNDGVRLMRAPR